MSQAIRFPDEDRNAVSLVISRRDGRGRGRGRVVGQSSTTRNQLACSDDDSASERPCWSVMRQIPGAENLPCAENCVSERLNRQIPVESTRVRLRGRSFALRCEAVGDQVVTTFRPLPDELPNHARRLTPREVDVLRLLADGLEGAEIAKVLGISAGTVRTHVENMRENLDCRTRAGLVSQGYRLRYLD